MLSHEHNFDDGQIWGLSYLFPRRSDFYLQNNFTVWLIYEFVIVSTHYNPTYTAKTLLEKETIDNHMLVLSSFRIYSKGEDNDDLL